MGKTKVMHNGIDCALDQKKYVEVNGTRVGIVPAAMCLGRELSSHETNATEIDHRISKPWSKFLQHKGELCSKQRVDIERRN